MSRPQAELLKGTLDMLILRALLAGPVHGYGIARWIEDRAGDLLAIEEGSQGQVLSTDRGGRAAVRS